MEIKNEVLYRVYFVLFGFIVPVAIVLLYRTIEIGIVERDIWRSKGKADYIEARDVEAQRGNILAADGSLLATSIPYFDIYMDPNSTAMSEDDFYNNIDSLAYCIATRVDKDLTVGAFRDYLVKKKQDSARYVEIKRGVSYAEKQAMSQFPLFNLGRMRGGFIAKLASKRRRPFNILAHRTIGYMRDDGTEVGLEKSFDEVLGGKAGKQLMYKVDDENDIWFPVDDLTHVQPQSGDDIKTTLDINLQEIAEEALLRGINFHDADWGTAVIMEVETGAIKAIANLGRWQEEWWETYNYAVGSAIEPGSTFKLASIMALLEDKYVSLEDSINIERGKTEFYNEIMVDATPFSYSLDSTSVRRVFEISSNVGIAKLINNAYGKPNKRNGNLGAEQFINRLKDFNLNMPTGVEIDGEARPYIKEAYNKDQNWSGTTLPWMSIGYELELTPLQQLAFYNAVANGGRLMQPYMVSEIQHYGKVLKRFPPKVVKQQIASPKTITQAQELLRGVVERGTAYKLKSGNYTFAGKTGTAQVNYSRTGNRRKKLGGYQASFAGYFPADKPVYSCIVVINNPQQNGFYGGEVAGPVFKEIADKCFATRLELHREHQDDYRAVQVSTDLPSYDVGAQEDFKKAFDYLELPYYTETETDFVVLRSSLDSLFMDRRTLPKNVVPSVEGMGLRDALYVLENLGLKVEFTGVGKVYRQSLRPGTRAKGQKIKISLR